MAREVRLHKSGILFSRVSLAVDGDRNLLHDVSFSCEGGSATALLGRSGSGKTTLLRTVNGLVRPSRGRVTVDGAEVAGSDLLALRHRIGYVIQESGLFPHMTVERNIAMSLELEGGHRKAEMRDRAAAAVERVGLQPDLLQRRPWQLSGGQRQRVGVARALLNEPKILLMDEPFGALDPLTRAEMQTTLRDLLREGGITTLMVTHDLPEALFLADRVVLMEAGRVVADVKADEVMRSEDESVRAYVRATQPRDHRTVDEGEAV